MVVDRKDEFKELTARCGALEAYNAMLREILGAGAGGPVAPEPPAQRLPAPLSSSASSEGKELGRIRGQCEALRQVLRQREDEVGKERADDISFEEQARPVTDVTGVTASPSRSRRAQSELEPLREPTPASAPSPSPSPSLSSTVAVCFRSRRA